MQFNPLQIAAGKRSEVEMELIFQNDGEGPLWVECDITAPPTLSLAPDKEMNAGRTRMGIAIAGGTCSKKVKLYAGAPTFAGAHSISLVVFAYDNEAVISQRIEEKFDVNAIG